MYGKCRLVADVNFEHFLTGFGYYFSSFGASVQFTQNIRLEFFHKVPFLYFLIKLLSSNSRRSRVRPPPWESPQIDSISLMVSPYPLEASARIIDICLSCLLNRDEYKVLNSPLMAKSNNESALPISLFIFRSIWP